MEERVKFIFIIIIMNKILSLIDRIIDIKFVIIEWRLNVLLINCV